MRKINKKNKKEGRKEYWHCYIGPVLRSEVPFGGDFPLRQTVKKKFFDMFEIEEGEEFHCYSGWGDSEEKTDLMLSLSHHSEEELENALEYLRKKNRGGKK